MESEHETSSTQDRLYQWSSTQDRLHLSFSLLHSHCLSFSFLHSVCFILIACHAHSHCFILIVILIACDYVPCLSSFLQYEIVCRCTYMRTLELSIGNITQALSRSIIQPPVKGATYCSNSSLAQAPSSCRHDVHVRRRDRGGSVPRAAQRPPVG